MAGKRGHPHFVPMGPFEILDHLLNFFAPALGVALLLAVFSPFFMKKRSFASVNWRQAAINFIVGASVLAGGLVFFGRDGKMLTYLVLVLAMATSQWWQLGGWKK
jgi:hypothetical protein